MVQAKTFLGARYQEWWTKWYFVDWGLTILAMIVTGILTLTVEPRHRFLPTETGSVDYPKKASIVPEWLLFVLTLAIPFIFFLLMQIRVRCHHDLHNALLGFFSGWAITILATTILKLSVGEYRPNFDRTSDTLASGQREAFPSGHASTSFVTMIYLSLYLSGKWKVFCQHQHGTVLGKAAICALPMVIAAFIAISRVIDYHHSIADVIAGSILGFSVGIMAYFLYWPSLMSDGCHLPKLHRPPPIKPTERVMLLP